MLRITKITISCNNTYTNDYIHQVNVSDNNYSEFCKQRQKISLYVLSFVTLNLQKISWTKKLLYWNFFFKQAISVSCHSPRITTKQAFVPPPTLEVSPATLWVSLFSGSKEVLKLVESNTGTDETKWLSPLAITKQINNVTIITLLNS